MKLRAENSCLVLIDVQGKLAQLMSARESLFRNIGILVKGCRKLSVPVLWCQQVPEALGETVEQIAGLLEGVEPVNKRSFSCWGDERFRSRLCELERSQVILCGIESHVCVYQTATDLLGSGFEVHVARDAVSSRTAENRLAGLERMSRMGAHIGCVEMILFEFLGSADHEMFREVAKLMK